MQKSQIDDLKELISFLKGSDEVISYLVKYPRGIILKEFHDDGKFMKTLEGAWSEAQKYLHEVINKIDHELATLQENIPDLWTHLRRCGLTGIELKLKTLLFERLRGNFEKTRAPRWTRRLLGLINSIFGSLSSVFPGIEPVKEFKDALEKIIKLRR